MKRKPIQKTRYKSGNASATRFVSEAEIVYDSKGRKRSVILPYRAYREAMAYLEDLDDLQAMKEVEHEKPIPWEEAKRILAKRRK
jgi:hypothetical protein